MDNKNLMKRYQANGKLEQILLNQGFIDTTSQIDKLKGKKSFKLTKNSRKEIYFDYINIRILESTKGHDSCYKMTEDELKYLLLFFKLKSTDFKEIDHNGKFNFKKSKERLDSLSKELQSLTKYNMHKPRRVKLKRILDSFENINWN